MSNNSLISQLVKNRVVNESLTTPFTIEVSGIYAIVISAKASAWWQNFPQFLKRFFQDDNLSVSLSGYSEELKWNGNDLEGATQTNIFISAFTEGSYSLSFKSAQTPEVSTLSIYGITSTTVNVAEFLPTPIEDKDRRPLLKLLCLDQPLAALTLTSAVLPGKVHPWSFFDDDDLKIVINGEIIKNELPKSHSDWYWCGRAQSNQDTSERTLTEKVDLSSKCLIEIFSDRTPEVKNLVLSLGTRLLSANFDPTIIIDDFTFTNIALGEDEIDKFLKKYGNGNPNHISNRLFAGKTVARLISESCAEFKINPKVIVTKLQAENGLLIGKNSINPSEEALNSALGSGVYDSGIIKTSLQGFSRQIHSAAETLRYWYTHVPDKGFLLQVDNAKDFRVSNKATFSLYKYTPHVAGAHLFFDVYKDLFENTTP